MARALIVTACLVVILAGLKAAATLVVPFLLATFLGIILAPPFTFMKRKGVPGAVALIVMVVGLVVLVILPAAERQSFAYAVALGALFGLVTYAAYDLTNLATLEGFPLKVALVDLVWGAVLCATVSATTFLVSTRLI